MGDAPWGVGRRDAGCPPPLCLLLLYGSADYGSPAARLVESLDPPSLVPHAQHRAHGEQRAARRAHQVSLPWLLFKLCQAAMALSKVLTLLQGDTSLQVFVSLNI